MILEGNRQYSPGGIYNQCVWDGWRYVDCTNQTLPAGVLAAVSVLTGFLAAVAFSAILRFLTKSFFAWDIAANFIQLIILDRHVATMKENSPFKFPPRIHFFLLVSMCSFAISAYDRTPYLFSKEVPIPVKLTSLSVPPQPWDTQGTKYFTRFFPDPTNLTSVENDYDTIANVMTSTRPLVKPLTLTSLGFGRTPEFTNVFTGGLFRGFYSSDQMKQWLENYFPNSSEIDRMEQNRNWNDSESSRILTKFGGLKWLAVNPFMSEFEPLLPCGYQYPKGRKNESSPCLNSVYNCSTYFSNQPNTQRIWGSDLLDDTFLITQSSVSVIRSILPSSSLLKLSDMLLPWMTHQIQTSDILKVLGPGVGDLCETTYIQVENLFSTDSNEIFGRLPSTRIWNPIQYNNTRSVDFFCIYTSPNSATKITTNLEINIKDPPIPNRVVDVSVTIKTILRIPNFNGSTGFAPNNRLSTCYGALRVIPFGSPITFENKDGDARGNHWFGGYVQREPSDPHGLSGLIQAGLIPPAHVEKMQLHVPRYFVQGHRYDVLLIMAVIAIPLVLLTTIKLGAAVAKWTGNTKMYVSMNLATVPITAIATFEHAREIGCEEWEEGAFRLRTGVFERKGEMRVGVGVETF